MFRIDGELMQKAAKIGNILYAHFLMLICSIPILTAGAALTALEYVLLKIYQDEDSGVTSLFFSSFKQNFKHGTIMWLIYFAVAWVLVLNINFLAQLDEPSYLLMFALHVIAVLLMLNMTWGFVLLSRYNNSAINTIKYAFSVGFIYIGYTVLMFTLAAGTIVLAFWDYGITPFVLIIGSILSGSIRPKLYSKVFDKIENVQKSGSVDQNIAIN